MNLNHFDEVLAKKMKKWEKKKSKIPIPPKMLKRKQKNKVYGSNSAKTCEICDQKFFTDTFLRLHMKTHYPDGASSGVSQDFSNLEMNDIPDLDDDDIEIIPPTPQPKVFYFEIFF